jgi:hypothetical protein
MYKPITLITKVSIDFDFDGIPEKVQSDLIDIIGGIGHDDIPFNLDWSSNENIIFKQYLIETFGEEIKQYDEFILLSC